MDPNETLRMMRETLAEIQLQEEEINSSDFDLQDATIVVLAGDLADQVEALDQWLSKGGFLPSDWKHK